MFDRRAHGKRRFARKFLRVFSVVTHFTNHSGPTEKCAGTSLSLWIIIAPLSSPVLFLSNVFFSPYLFHFHRRKTEPQSFGRPGDGVSSRTLQGVYDGETIVFVFSVTGRVFRAICSVTVFYQLLSDTGWRSVSE